MDVLTIATTAAITSLVSGLVGAIVATAIGMAKDKRRNDNASNQALQDGMRALLWRELKNIHSDAIANGGMDTEERKHLESVYDAYHGIGGNGTGTRLYEDAMNQPMLD
ncbi:MAG: hypothetical protein KBT28_12440 [Bacteroidales bacterium]|nr:hypothetical protein [Candidatus Colimorpha merdihippi]